MVVSKQEVRTLSGNEAVAYAVKQSDVDVVAAYPVTPQTIIVERISEYVHDGEIATEFVCVESEHSALSACLTASTTGAIERSQPQPRPVWRSCTKFYT